MKQAIGSVPLYNIIIVFIVITFGFLSATLSYMKAFKVNSRITREIENHEGYNILAEQAITNTLTSIGYRIGEPGSYTCPVKNGKEAVQAISNGNKNHYYCVYEYDYYKNKNVETKYFNYGVLTYIFIDLPFGFDFQIPVYSETEKIFHFTEK